MECVGVKNKNGNHNLAKINQDFQIFQPSVIGSEFFESIQISDLHRIVFDLDQFFKHHNVVFIDSNYAYSVSDLHLP